MPDPDTRQRVFFGLHCPVLPDIRALLEELENSDVSRDGWLRVVPEANLHLTLRYVGPVPDHRVAALCDMARHLVAQYRPFSYSLHGAGHFSHALWLGADVPSRVHDLVERLDGLLLEAGFPGDTKAFLPHVTVARLRHRCRTQAEALCRQIAKRAFGQVPVESVCLYRSDPGSDGVRYTSIGEFPLCSDVSGSS